jgi:hypothetical protein
MNRNWLAAAALTALVAGTATAQTEYSTSQSSSTRVTGDSTQMETTKSVKQSGRKPVETDEWTVDSTTTTRPVPPPPTVVERSTTTTTTPVAPPVVDRTTKTTTTTTTDR